MTEHPLASVIKLLSRGDWLPVDGSWTRIEPWRAGLYCVAAFTGRAYIAAPAHVTDAAIDALGADGFGGASDPRLVAALAGPEGWIDSLGVLLVARSQHVARGSSAATLVERPDLVGHPRAIHATAIRRQVRVYGSSDADDASVVTHSLGIAGLDEFSYEVDQRRRGSGGGAPLARAALDLLPDGEYVLASVAPGNAASLRALLSCGFRPIGSMQLFTVKGKPPAHPDALLTR